MLERYKVSQRCMAYLLLVSIFLQSCYNPHNPLPPRSVEGEKETKIIQIVPLQTILPEEPHPSFTPSSSQEKLAALTLPAGAAERSVDKGRIDSHSSLKTSTQVEQPFSGDRPCKKSNQLKISKKPKIHRTHSLQAPKQLDKIQEKARGRRSTSLSEQDLNERELTYQEKAPSLVSQAMIPLALSKREASHPLAAQTFQAKGGYQVRFQQQDKEKWEAVVEESLPGGIKRTLVLPVYLDPGMSLSTLYKFKNNLAWQTNHIHVIFQKEKSYLLIGSMGLRGGMVEEQEENKGEGKEEQEEFSNLVKIGEGNFGVVYKGLWKRNLAESISVAIKTIRDLDQIEELSKETEIMKSIIHKNIVRFFGVHQLKIGLDIVQAIITELMTEGSVEDYLKKHTTSTIKPLSIVSMALDAAKGMRYLHENDIIHRDLAARNLLLKVDNGISTVKVSDFGLSRKVGSEKESDSVYYQIGFSKIPFRWSAPEVFIKRQVSTKGDLWSFGVLLYELFTLCKIRPYKDLSNDALFEKIIAGEAMYRYLKIEDSPSGVQELLDRCMDNDSHKRPVFNKIVYKLEEIQEQVEASNNWKLEEANQVGSGLYASARIAKEEENPAGLGNSEVQNELGNSYQVADRYKKAAKQGDAAAQYNLALMYQNGKGVVRSYKKAVRWYQEAAEQGHASAQNSLGFMYQNGQGVEKDYKKAYVWFEKAANQGDEHAQNSLGNMYKNGQGVKQDYRKSFEWYEKAADQGNKKAHAYLGIMYYNGWGVSKDKLKATRLLQEAFEAVKNSDLENDSEVQYILGFMYYNGEGVKKDAQQALKWFQKAADQGNVNAQNILGRIYSAGQCVKQDYQQAYAWYEKAADQGNTHAQTNIGVMYYDGKGVKQDYQQAYAWYQKAADQGNANAQYSLALMYQNGQAVVKDSKKAFEWFQQAAEQGDARAQNSLGIIYQNGQIVGKDSKKAAEWYQKAAMQGNANAQYKLCLMYYAGEGVKQDSQQAVDWLQKAAQHGHPDAQNKLVAVQAEQGDASAQFKLGKMYYNGKGVKKDHQQAYAWYQKAAIQGNADAQFNLALMYDKGEGVKQDSKKAFEWAQKAAVQGHVNAQFNLGVMYHNGEGAKKDFQKAFEWFQKAADQGSASAQSNLGLSYYKGEGVKKDYKKAFEWCQKAAVQGNANAQTRLGIMYYKGKGIKKDYQQAHALFQKAAQQGYASAQNILRVCYVGGGLKPIPLSGATMKMF